MTTESGWKLALLARLALVKTIESNQNTTLQLNTSKKYLSVTFSREWSWFLSSRARFSVMFNCDFVHQANFFVLERLSLLIYAHSSHTQFSIYNDLCFKVQTLTDVGPIRLLNHV